MNKSSNIVHDLSALRKKAEFKMANQHANLSKLEAIEAKLFHELQVHQIELEMQHEAMQEAIAETNNTLSHYTKLFEFAPIAYCLLDFEGNMLELNFRGASLLGLDSSKLSWRRFASVISPESRFIYQRFLNSLASSPDKQDCMVQLLVNDQLTWAKLEAVPDQQQKTCLMAIIDISEQTASIEQGIRNEAALKAAMQIDAIGHWKWNTKGNKLNCSEAFYRILVRDQSNPFATYMDWSSSFTPESWAILHTAFAICRSQGQPFELDVELANAAAPGQWITLHAQAHRNTEGSIYKLQGTIQAINKLNDEMAAENIAPNLDLLNSAASLALAASDDKPTLLANISHDIHSPLNTIIGMTYFLRKANNDPVHVEQLHKIESSAQHVLSLVKNTLDLSQIDVGQLQLVPYKFVLNDLFQQIHALVSGPIAAKGLEFLTDIDHVTPLLNADLSRLRQALLNYINHALKHTESGFIKLSFKLLAETPAAVMIRFEVQDSGKDIPEAEVARLFEATSERDDRSELALVINRKLAELMQGEAGVTTNPGAGTQFWMTVWLQRAQIEARQQVLENAEHLAAALLGAYLGERILLVDDNPLNQEIALALLTQAGLVVDCAANTATACAKVRQNNYALVLITLQLPDRDEWEISHTLRAKANKPDLPIIAISDKDLDRSAYDAAGFTDFIFTPLVAENLYASLLRCLSSLNQDDSLNALKQRQLQPIDDEDNSHAVEIMAEVLREVLDVEISATLQSILDTHPLKFIQILDNFAQRHHQDLQKTLEFLEHAKRQEAIAIIQHLKAVLSTLGLAQISTLLSLLESVLITDADLASCISLTEQCDLELAPLFQQILFLLAPGFD